MATTRTRPTDRRASQLRGAVDVAAATLAGGLRTVAGVHWAIANQPFAALRPIPALGAASEPVRQVHDGVTGLVYAGLGAGLALVAGAARLAAAAAPDREPRGDSLAGTAVAALNGFAGDRLARDANPLAATMGLRHRGRALAPRRAALAAALPAASPRVALFVHGLACNEAMWWRHAERHYGDSLVSHGVRLERELGITPLYLRYNSGLAIADNGRRLARLLAAVVAEWPVPLEELILVGHSMGGLVVRHAVRRGGEWAPLVRHAFYLGSPHRGAPLAKAAHAAGWLLSHVAVTSPLAEVVAARSAGVKDLRRRLHDELPADMRHHFLAATVTRDPRHPLGAVVGDWLVRPTSALGGRRPGAVARQRFGGLTHLDLLNHPEVYRYLAAALR